MEKILYCDAFGSSWQQRPRLWLLMLSKFSLHDSPFGWGVTAMLLPSPKLQLLSHLLGNIALELGQALEA